MAPWEEFLPAVIPRMTVPHEMVGRVRKATDHRKKKNGGIG